MEKIDRNRLRTIRYAFQWGLLAFMAWGGYRFYLFVEHFISGTPQVARPPMVEGFLPIGAFMSLKLWVTRGIFAPEHPSALVIFCGALLVSFVAAKGFCGWICPVGTLSEGALKLGRRIFDRNFRMHKYVDYPLRSLKYILLFFFVNVIAIRMSPEAIEGFMAAPYWKVADVKMLFFFTDMSLTAMVVIGALVALSMLFNNFWCRYLCPYGALTGLLGLMGPLKITRTEDKCIHCHKCTKACPNLIDVEANNRVRSPECSGCLSCISHCPSKGALDVSAPFGARIKPKLFALLIALVFFGVIWAGILSGHWHSSVTYEDYKALVPQASRLDHP